MISPDSLLSRLEGVRQFGQDRWLARCPAHDDRSPSLSIRLSENKLLIHCWAGCGPDDILAAIGLTWSDLFADRWDAAQAAQFAQGHVRRKKLMSAITQADYATWVIGCARADLDKGRTHNLEDRATLAMAVHILEEGHRHG